MKLVITIDTEEDNWGDFIPQGYSLENITKIPRLQALFDEFEVTPTYLITYPVATDERSISILKPILDDDRCEIGSHCHPWNTPPFEEETIVQNSMLCNLPSDLQNMKLGFLDRAIMENFGIEPISFRAGRWGYSDSVAKNLFKHGYKIDTSISAYTDWTNWFGPDFSNISPRSFRFSCENIFETISGGQMLEIPATVGYLQKNFTFCNNLLTIIRRTPLKYIGLIGILNRLHLVNKAWLNPENSDSKTMIALAKRMMKNQYRIINMMFHSSTLKPGLTPFIKTGEDGKRFIKNIREFLVFTRDNGIESIKISDALKII